MNNKYIGVLSGTSMDAVDVALVEFLNNKPTLLTALNYPLPEDFRNDCLRISQTGNTSIDEFCTLNVKAGLLFADAILYLLKEAKVSSDQIQAIGSHGQNLRHSPNIDFPFSLQIGDPNIIVEKTGITTIANFRSADIAAGGQGAPLAPGFHQHVFASAEENRIIANIGGISNITLLHSDSTIPVTGFDTGPGNCLMDLWIKKHFNQSYDKDGELARSGRINEALLQQCLQDPYFSQKPPKSTGREYFNLEWLNQKMHATHILTNSISISPKDIQATLLALTANSLANAIIQHEAKDAAVYVCGGGVYNGYLIEMLSSLLQRTVNSTEKLGISPDWVEAMLFAWLAKQTLAGKPGNCPAVTGARSIKVLGGIYGYQTTA